MPSIRVIDESGELETVETHSRTVTFVLDDEEHFQPAVVERVEFDDEGEMSHISHDSCNKFENRRESNKRPDIVVEGIAAESELSTVKNLDQQTELTLISDLFSGPVAVRRTVIEQTDDLIEITTDGKTELAFGFQLIVKNSMHHDSALTPNIEGTAIESLAEATDPFSDE